MRLFKKLCNKNSKKDQKTIDFADEKFILKTKNKTITILKLIQSEICYLEYKLAQFNSLSDKEVEYLYNSIDNMKKNILICKDFAKNHNFAEIIVKSNENLEKLELLKEIFDSKLTGIIY